MFRNIIVAVCLLTAYTAMVSAQDSQRKSVAVTVYNQNLGVIKDVRSMDVKPGRSEIRVRDVAQLIDPTSVHINFSGTVLEQNYQYDLIGMEKILQKYLDKDIQLTGKQGEFIEGKLLSSYNGQIVLQKKDGGLLMIPDISEYRLAVGTLPEGLITVPTLIWSVDSKNSGAQDVEISYQTGGMNWHAEYVAVLNENDTKLGLNSWVSIDNRSGASYKDAVLKLVAGDVNLVSGDGRGPRMDRDVMMMAKTEAVQQFQEKEFFEYHIYNLQRPATLANNETKQISLFEADNINVVKKFLYRSGVYGYWRGNQPQNKVAVVVEFENKENNNLGVPMPKGKVRLYKSDGKALEFVGEDWVDHTPRDEKVKLTIGDAFDIAVEDNQTEDKRISDRVSEQTFEIKLRNRKKEDVTVEVERSLGTNWEILNSSHSYEKKDAFNVIFKVPVKKGEESVLKFKVRYQY